MESQLPSISADSAFSSRMMESDYSGSSGSGGPAYNAETPKFQEIDAVHELHRPKVGPPIIELVFFHGLQLGDYSEAYLKTWMTPNQSQSWITTWLVEKFPQSRVLSVSYDTSITENTAKDGSIDLPAVAVSLATFLIEGESVGDTQCPIVLIGHSLGGLVVKEICSHAERLSRTYSESPRVVPIKKFLNSVKGTFFYATPNGGSLQRELAAILSSTEPFLTPKYLESLNEDTGRINEDFAKLRRKYGWKTYGVGEADETVISGVQGTSSVVLVDEGEASLDMDMFSKILGTNHLSICQPQERTSESFRCLVDFVMHIVNDQEDAESEDFLLHCGLPEHGVSLEGRVERVMEQLQLREAHPVLVALVGMGGIGKTTLARAVFIEIHASFEYSSFIYNAREALRLRDLDALIRENLYKGEKKDVRTSSNQSVSVWKTLKGKKVLLVMDDVDAREQISIVLSMIDSNWFGKGTRVIATSRVRNEDVLPDFINYDVRGLTQEESRMLFCSHAENPEVPDELVNKVVAQCGGLPLTLEIVGAYLRRETNVAVWEETINRLQRAESASGSVDDRLWNKLKLCYESLENMEQEMFLDLATIFYDHHDLELLKAAWKRSMKAPEVGLKNLVDRCLIRIVHQATKNDIDCGLILQRERVWMHAQLRDMGQVIAAHSRPRILVSTSLGQEDPALNNLITTNAKGEPMIKGLKVSYVENRRCRELRTNIPASCFYLPDLRYLVLENVDISGFIVKFSSSLALLSLHHCRRVLHSSSMSWHNWPIRDTDLASLANLAALEICTDPKIDRPGSPGSISSSSKSTLPTGFHKLAQLRVLLLRSSAVKELPPKFGCLPRLEYLDLRTRELAALPESFGQLTTLERLCLQCRALQKLPATFGELASLRVLELHSLTVDELPDNFGRLQNLRKLDIYSCQKLFSLPDSIGELTGLESMVLSSCNQLTLPESFGQLQGLKDLEIRYCERLKELPGCFGQLHALHTLKLLHFYELAKLPSSFGQLSSLQDLEMTQCLGLRKLPDSFGELRSLRKFKIVECYDLSALPASFGQLLTLQSLTIHRCQLRTLPESFGRLKSLQTLKLEKLPSLRSLPETFGHLWAMKTLTIHQCENLPCLPVSFGHLRGLQRLEMELQSRIFTKLPDSFGRLPALQTLKILSCHLQALPETFGGLSMLEKMRISLSKGVKALPDIPDSFEQLEALQDLVVEVPPKAVAMDVLSGWLEKLEDMGWICTRGSEEGVYAFAKVSRHTPSVFDFAHYMHKRRGVECVCAAPSKHSGRQSRERAEFGL
ncbi:hypothetical protein MARPO_0010s0128 [Marchantia polymorpha]|nr:hypothetical protein MARPO_0010s0128 [Marchantia polymorpha]|eukprot:PTQ46740.1 hypothetical protein MARPO_0010s0128 [Marchantia polymorpha]